MDKIKQYKIIKTTRERECNKYKATNYYYITKKLTAIDKTLAAMAVRTLQNKPRNREKASSISQSEGAFFAFGRKILPSWFDLFTPFSNSVKSKTVTVTDPSEGVFFFFSPGIFTINAQLQQGARNWIGTVTVICAPLLRSRWISIRQTSVRIYLFRRKKQWKSFPNWKDPHLSTRKKPEQEKKNQLKKITSGLNLEKWKAQYTRPWSNETEKQLQTTENFPDSERKDMRWEEVK